MAAGAGRVGVSAAARALYAAGMSSTDEPAAGPRESQGSREPRESPAPASQAEAIVNHAEHSISEDAIVAAARERAVDIGAGAVTPAVGALLCVLAKLTDARAVVEVGTGAEALEEPAAAFAKDLEAALADTSDLTPEERSARNGLANRQVTLR